MRNLKAILAVAIVVALLAFSGNGKDDEASGGGETSAQRAAGATVSGADAPGAARTATAGKDASPGPEAQVKAGEHPSGDFAASETSASTPKTWPTWPESASVEGHEYVKISCPVLVYTTPEAVWEVLTTVRSFFLWYPHWEREENVMRRLSAVGDTISFYENGVLAGRSVVTFLERLKELRIVHELESGDPSGSILISLSQTDRGVGLTYEELSPACRINVDDERQRICKQVALIKRLAEGE